MGIWARSTRPSIGTSWISGNYASRALPSWSRAAPARRSAAAPCAPTQEAGAILTGIEAEARRAGITLLKLETGIHNHEALALYRRLGYRDCRAFGDYLENGVSLFLEKRLG
jgi:GNAT superfamily N-acetyltransferase